MDLDRVDLIVQYALARAGLSDDWEERERGVTELLKYVYLADLAHAERTGTSYTGVGWRFFKFGPWAPEVRDRIPGAAQALGCVERALLTDDGERARWSLRQDADKVASDLETRIGSSAVATAVRKAVRDFANDLPGLLNAVYTTAPMLHAAPNEPLTFLKVEVPPKSAPVGEDAPPTPRQEKKRRERMNELRAKFQQRASGPSTPPLDPPEIFDAAYEAMVAALDADAGAPIPTTRGALVFDNTIWKSRGRHERGHE